MNLVLYIYIYMYMYIYIYKIPKFMWFDGLGFVHVYFLLGASSSPQKWKYIYSYYSEQWFCEQKMRKGNYIFLK